ncbi:hypothetical protein LV716_16445 [Flagellimonas sp. HMM57]|uniref:hypothetical protein n=1 Tax=unclassified Flagellimonas TaxID=2644544 RepID=UPI0013D250DF|nr:MULTISPECIES: hypothetical protein [unclassified Flagellimonas]UII75832.1 hypothetical protein LV716_16445 [Flagellimonas sp. HMM57]
MGMYVIAIKRGKEDSANVEWTELIQRISNVEIINNYRNKRILISTDEDGIIEIKNELSPDDFNIEPVIDHKRLDS